MVVLPACSRLLGWCTWMVVLPAMRRSSRVRGRKTRMLGWCTRVLFPAGWRTRVLFPAGWRTVVLG